MKFNEVRKPHKVNTRIENEAKAFWGDASNLGVDLNIIPDLLKAYNSLSEETKAFVADKETIHKEFPEFLVGQTQQKKHVLTFGEYMDLRKQDQDVCILSQDGWYCSRPATCYLTPEEQSRKTNRYSYSAEEMWQRSLPVVDIDTSMGADVIILGSNMPSDMLSFLLDEGEFESTEWMNLSSRASWADAGFEERLAYLQEGKPFELPFDSHCMDAESPEDRSALCEMLANNRDVFVAQYVEPSTDFYAYALMFDRIGVVHVSDDIPIRHTERGKGLCSTMDGKLACAKHEALKSQMEGAGPSIRKDAPERD